MDLRQMVRGDEVILYEGRPKFSCFILECIFNKMAIIALIWGLFDGFVVVMSLQEGEVFGLAFVMFHAMPVWIYLANILTCHAKWKKTQYIITDKNIYTSNGILTRHNNMTAVDAVCDVDFHQGIIDHISKTADIIVSVTHMHGFGGMGSSHHNRIVISDVAEYDTVYRALRDMMEQNRQKMQAVQQNMMNGFGNMAAMQMQQGYISNTDQESTRRVKL